MYLRIGAVISIIVFAFLLLQLSPEEGSCEVAEEANFQVMSFNIKRNDLFGDRRDLWSNRSSALVEMICRQSPDVIGLQEVHPSVLEELKVKLLPAYDGYGVGRENGYDAGESTPIFYKKERLEMVKDGTFWLADGGPGLPAYGFGGHKRIVSWVRFRVREKDQELVVFNTHFDNRSKYAQEESARLLIEKIREVSNGLPVVVTGDLNFNPESEAYRIITNARGEKDLSRLLDSRDSAKAGDGLLATFSGFDPDFVIAPDILDYVLVDESWDVLSYRVLQDTVKGRFLSDHRPIIVTLTSR